MRTDAIADARCRVKNWFVRPAKEAAPAKIRKFHGVGNYLESRPLESWVVDPFLTATESCVADGNNNLGVASTSACHREVRPSVGGEPTCAKEYRRNLLKAQSFTNVRAIIRESLESLFGNRPPLIGFCRKHLIVRVRFASSLLAI